jgi:hypothetical protein
MKTLFILASVMVVVFIAAPNKVEAQKTKATVPVENAVNVYLRQKVTSESGGNLSLTGFRKTNGYEQGYGIYVIEWQAEILFQQECWKPGDIFEGYWQNFSVLERQPQGLESVIVGVGTAKHYDKGTTIRLTGNATLRKTEQGWRIEGFSVKTTQVLAVQPTPVSQNQITFSDGTRYEGGMLGGKPNGRGVLTFSDGRRQEGNWSKGKFLGSSTITGRKTTTTPSKPVVSGTTEKTGTYAITSQFDSAFDFSEGLALVRIGDYKTGKYLYVDKTGKMVIEVGNLHSDFDYNAVNFFNNRFVDFFSNGLATVKIGNIKSYKSGYINKTGKIDIFPQFGWNFQFSEGFAAVSVIEANDKWGFIDTNGKVLIAPKFDRAGSFSEGLANVLIGNYMTGKWGYIDKSGKTVVTPQFNVAREFSEGFALIQIGDSMTGKWGYIDKTGNYLVTPQFDDASDFSEGLASVRVGDTETGKWGYIDKTGKMVIKLQFDSAWKFSEGLAEVQIGDDKTGKWGYIDKTGKIVVTPQFDYVRSFSEGLAAVRIGDDKTGKWGYIDKAGKLVITPQFDFAYSFMEGLASVRIGDQKTGKWGYIYR